MSDYRLEEPYDPENEDGPEDTRAECCECGHRMAPDDPGDPICLLGVYEYCQSCAAEMLGDPFDDSDYDASKEEEQ